ncbi:MAG TPA: hypothetical protein DD723_01425 [Candidatus Omnitrophica bacterium]|nr:MAG: hypothetical protein A2Z81_02000 [Omnitrophica WOR_2 bacterium GWA2_45_18]HBR14192.1 hypothetical protein [Candidatus Omnitrophota bacterium]
MIPRFTNESDDPVAVLTRLVKQIDGIRQVRNELEEDLKRTELSLNEFIGSMDAVGQRLKRIKAEPSRAAAPNPPPAPASPTGMTLDEFKTHMGSILQGSLDAVSDKLTDKIAAMLKELGTLSGPAREIKIREYQQSGEYDTVDFSSLYKNQEVQSNLGEVGVEEKESKGIESSLERIRQLRGKPKPGNTPEDKKE